MATLASGLLLASCGSTVDLPPSPPVLTVGMSEYRFNHMPTVPSGRVVFEVSNTGHIDHELTILRLPDDFPGTIDSQLRSGTRRALSTLVVLSARRPGATATFAMDLARGRYAMICTLRDGDGVAHTLKGMSSDLSVR